MGGDESGTLLLRAINSSAALALAREGSHG
jgi:hypothetical protein